MSLNEQNILSCLTLTMLFIYHNSHAYLIQTLTLVSIKFTLTSDQLTQRKAHALSAKHLRFA